MHYAGNVTARMASASTKRSHTRAPRHRGFVELFRLKGFRVNEKKGKTLNTMYSFFAFHSGRQQARRTWALRARKRFCFPERVP
jgi:hypothetical protein